MTPQQWFAQSSGDPQAEAPTARHRSRPEARARHLTIIATVRNSAFRLSGSSLRPALINTTLVSLGRLGLNGRHDLQPCLFKQTVFRQA